MPPRSIVPVGANADCRPMPIRRQRIDHLLKDTSRVDADVLNEWPGKTLLQKKLGLLAFLAFTPVTGLDRTPVDLIQLREVGAILKKVRSRIRQCERPSAALLVGPVH